MKMLRCDHHGKRFGRTPNLFVVGFQKCATSAVFWILNRHPMIAGASRCSPHTSSRYAPKEMHFFDKDRNFSRGPSWYASHFDHDSPFAIEATPDYISSEKALKRMAKTVPDAKIIVFLRDPVKRAHSAWNHWTQMPRRSRWRAFDVNAGFRENIEMEVEALKERSFHNSFVSRGFYIDQIEMLERYFSREQIFFGFAERLKQGHEEIERLQRFIGVPVMDLPNESYHARDYNGVQLDEDTTVFLRKIYEPYDERLAGYLGEALPWPPIDIPSMDSTLDTHSPVRLLNHTKTAALVADAPVFPRCNLASTDKMEDAVRDPALYPRTDDSRAQLAVITAYWNFSDYQRPIANLLRFLREMDFQGIPVYGMEIYLPGTPPLMRANARWLCLEVSEDNILWQKEAMLNRIAREVPRHISCIAALDSDIHFGNPEWSKRSVVALETSPAVQPFTLAVWSSENGRVEMTRSCAAKDGLSAEWSTHPGFGWVYRREFFEGPGCYPWCVVGGGDTATSSGLLGLDPHQTTERSVGNVNLSSGVYSEWVKQVRDYMGGERPGWVEGPVWHEWHGDWKSRHYVDRHRDIMETFDASEHVRLDPRGLLEWTELAPSQYRKKLRNYFNSRKEDGAL